MLYHTASCKQRSPDSPLAFQFHVPRSNQTHLKRVGQTCSRQSECPWKCAWVVPGTQAGQGGHPSAKDSQRDHAHASDNAEQSLILEEDTCPTDLHVPQSQNNDWLKSFLDEKSVKIINSDLNQMQNDIWWTWFFVEFWNNNWILKQIKYVFDFLHGILFQVFLQQQWFYFFMNLNVRMYHILLWIFKNMHEWTFRNHFSF